LFGYDASNTLRFAAAGNATIKLSGNDKYYFANSGGFQLASALGVAWNNGATAPGTIDVSICRDATGVAKVSASSTACSGSGGTFKAAHFQGGGNAPTAAPGSSLGSGGSVSLNQATDASGRVTITTGTGAAAGDLARITFASTYSTEPNCTLTAADAATAALQLHTGSTLSTILYINTANAPASSTTYVVKYVCMK
jgi:hypothetical protein